MAIDKSAILENFQQTLNQRERGLHTNTASQEKQFWTKEAIHAFLDYFV